MVDAQAEAVFVALAGGFHAGDVVWHSRRKSYAVVAKVWSAGAGKRYCVKELRPADAWKLFDHKKKAFEVDGRRLFVWGGLFRVRESEISLGR